MNFCYETKKIKQGFTCVIGCDEVGRGSLAGPVVAVAVVLHSSKYQVASIKQIKDSKQLTPKKREELAEIIKQNCVAWEIGMVEHHIIDKINIHHATLLAMRRAIENLIKSVSFGTSQVFCAIDGKFSVPGLNVSQEAIVGGDNKVLSIAAASIVAKVYRDNLMTKLSLKYPKYGFFRHKGYGTLHHRLAIKHFGLSPVHRLSFSSHLL